jgi:hypothetical protein
LAEVSKFGLTPSPKEISDNVFQVLFENYSSALLWSKKKEAYFKFPDESYQVFGHTPWVGGAEINEDSKYIALDTGCGTCFPYTLSGVLLREDGSRKIITSREKKSLPSL